MDEPVLCSQCNQPLPDDWEPPIGATAKPVCPACAVQHIRRKSQRLKVITTLLDMYGVDADEQAARELESKLKSPAESKPKEPPPAHPPKK
ncbi:MAG: hypothetical protein M5U26_15400 [Planctomycetota bacterium]|nr:hypothetical protein [Planctomycetota bacterium]